MGRLQDGWYLMSTADLEVELARWRSGKSTGRTNLQPLTIEEALAYRDRGNLPDEHGRTLRLVLHIESEHELKNLDAKRLRFEPDYHESPEWRRAGSKPVNVVPLRRPEVRPEAPGPWWEDERMAALEREWESSGAAAGLRIPGEYRGFVFKTIAALESAGRAVTVDNVVASVRRWLSPPDVQRLLLALQEANRGRGTSGDSA